MEEAFATALTEFLKLGLPGLFIVLLLYLVTHLKKDNDAKQKKIDELQETRVREAAETVRTLGTVAMANDKVAEALQAIADEQQDLIEVLKRKRA